MLLGAKCAGPAPELLLWLSGAPSDMQLGETSAFQVAVYNADVPVQAFDLGISIDPSILEIVSVSASGFFDLADRGLAMPPVTDPQTGMTTGIVDFNHGVASRVGELRIATVRVRAIGEGSSQVRLVPAGIYTAEDVAFDVAVIPSNITVSP